ncbi:MAG TPA: YceI family protein [Candidatus Limnocylindrales bacterium]|jgi:polyisoprenoid-binding protein YceI
MTVPAPAPVRSRRTGLLALGALIVVVGGAAGLWYLFFRPAGPAPVSLGSTPVATPASSASASGTAQSSAAAPAASPATGATTGIGGTWSVDPSIGSFGDFSSSFVGYRVQEELASVGATEAVGRTPDVSGSLTVDGTTITAAAFTADLTTLVSDESRRDGQLRNQALETSRFPTATFTLTQPVDLASIPAEGQAVDVTATGDLSLHGVTNTVQVPMQAKLEHGVVTVVGTLPIVFADYDIQKPTSFVVLSVDDHGVMEFQLHFAKA